MSRRKGRGTRSGKHRPRPTGPIDTNWMIAREADRMLRGEAAAPPGYFDVIAAIRKAKP